MGYKAISLQLTTDYHRGTAEKKIEKALKIREFSYEIENKSLDARQRNNIHWLVRVGVLSKEIAGGEPLFTLSDIPHQKRKQRALVVGSGPAGFFAALVLQKAGLNTILIERGSEVDKRAEGIRSFETTGVFSPVSNYAFGEGGAGTFSDGKLTSRTSISQKKNSLFIQLCSGRRTGRDPLYGAPSSGK